MRRVKADPRSEIKALWVVSEINAYAVRYPYKRNIQETISQCERGTIGRQREAINISRSGSTVLLNA